MNINNTPKSSQLSLINTFRELWRLHFIWHKELMVNIVCNFGDLSFIIERRNENVRDFADELQKYYGYNKAKIFESLFYDHNAITTQFIKDIKARDTKSADADRIKCYQNADETAEFLSSINPYWTTQEWQLLLYNHLDFIEKEAAFRLSTKCTTPLLNDEEEERHMLSLADYMANGIIQQFKI